MLKPTLSTLLPGLLVLSAQAQTPTISAGGITNGATLSRTISSALAPGSIATITGTDLAAAPVTAMTLPWPQTLGDVSVTFDGLPAAVIYVSPRQVNVQVPWSVLDRDQTSRAAAVVVTRNGVESAPMSVAIARVSPGIFTTNAMGTGAAIVANADGTRAQTAGEGSRPARIGSTISFWATGLGTVTPTSAAGVAPPGIIRRTVAIPEVLIGGRPAQVVFSGLEASSPGVNRINAVVPSGATPGNAVPLQIRAGGITTADTVTIAIDGATEPAITRPGADASAIWDFVFRQNFRQNFSLVPGKDQLYEGIAPHSQALTVYLNPVARQAIESKAGSMPAGSMIIKEAHSAAGMLNASLIMYKITGFDPANNDWFYSTRQANGSMGASGSVAGCFGCHARAKESDYMFLVSPLAAPEPNAAAVRDFIEKQNYRLTWRLWPGTSAFQPSGAPHGTLVSIWVNELAYNAIRNRPGQMPAGAIVLKENYNGERVLQATSIMYKSQGSNPSGGDWYWLQQTAAGQVAAEGRVQGCISCHQQNSANDHLWAGSIERFPDTKAAAVWDYVARQDYKSWKLFPGTTAQMRGNAPHGAFITTYVNEPALNAIEKKRGAMPPGSILVKENYGTDRNLAAVTLMYKSEGFDPDRNDWYWMQRMADGSVRAEGKVSGCINCHTAQASNDYLFLGRLQ